MNAGTAAEKIASVSGKTKTTMELLPKEAASVAVVLFAQLSSSFDDIGWGTPIGKCHQVSSISGQIYH